MGTLRWRWMSGARRAPYAAAISEARPVP
jgi:hypothetical protein